MTGTEAYRDQERVFSCVAIIRDCFRLARSLDLMDRNEPPSVRVLAEIADRALGYLQQGLPAVQAAAAPTSPEGALCLLLAAAANQADPNLLADQPLVDLLHAWARTILAGPAEVDFHVYDDRFTDFFRLLQALGNAGVSQERAAVYACAGVTVAEAVEFERRGAPIREVETLAALRCAS